MPIRLSGDLSKSLEKKGRPEWVTTGFNTRVHQALSKRETEVVKMSGMQMMDSLCIFTDYDFEKTGLLTRGGCKEALRAMGVEERFPETFDPFAQTVFDAASADSCYMSLKEFQQVYYMVNVRYPAEPKKPEPA
eukprot:GEMP01027464.1.p1 GENE.GEMP01027464.1~~GEMP01027464.1.p1  ORF type:complete len:134 (+),score=27.27 GEMP01027464.1:410-811(+)